MVVFFICNFNVLFPLKKWAITHVEDTSCEISVAHAARIILLSPKVIP